MFKLSLKSRPNTQIMPQKPNFLKFWLSVWTTSYQSINRLSGYQSQLAILANRVFTPINFVSLNKREREQTTKGLKV
jgi:hypothetical protein